MDSLLQTCTGSLSPGIFITNNSPDDRQAAINEGHSPGFHLTELIETEKTNIDDNNSRTQKVTNKHRKLHIFRWHAL